MPFIAAAPDTVKWTDKWTTIGTLLAVVAALLIAIWGNVRDSLIRKRDRADAVEQLSAEIRRAEGQRRIDRAVDHLLRAVSAHALWKGPEHGYMGAGSNLQMLRALVALLPDDVALLIRRDAGVLSIPSDSESARLKLYYLVGDDVPPPNSVDGNLIAREVAIDMRRLTSGDTRPMIDDRYWWDSADAGAEGG